MRPPWQCRERPLTCSPGVWGGDPSSSPPDLCCFPYQYICNDLWPNPLKYYGKKTEAGEETEKRTGEKALPGNAADGCQVGGHFLSIMKPFSLG